MTSLASKNLYELLGNDPDQDPDLRVEPPPVNPVDKTAPRAGKRNGTGEAPVEQIVAAEGRGGRGGRGTGRGRGRGGNDAVFYDGENARNRNRERPVEGGAAGEDRPPRRDRGYGNSRGEGRGRGGRGRGRGGRGNDDRHSRTVHSGPDDQAKQAEKGWGEETATGELADEQAGQAAARQEEKNAGEGVEATASAVADDEPAPEPEDKSKSYADYLAELAEKKAQLGGSLPVRQANEGGKNQPEGKTVEKKAEEDYFGGASQKARKERERKEKNVFTLDHDIQAREQAPVRGGRGGRGGFRGDRGGERLDRGELPDRGDRPERGGRFEGGRGEGRGRGRGRGEGRGEFRGGRGGRGGGGQAPPPIASTQDFPGLG